MSHTSVALMAQYLNVRQRKLGTIIIQTVHMLQHDSADTGSLPVEDFIKHSQSSPALVPSYQWRRLRTNGGGYLERIIVTKSLGLDSWAP